MARPAEVTNNARRRDCSYSLDGRAFVIAGLPLIYVGVALRWAWVRDWRWRALHLGAIGFVAAEPLAGIVCPLTVWEDALRQQQTGESFIEGWVDGSCFTICPHGLSRWHTPPLRRSSP